MVATRRRKAETKVDVERVKSTASTEDIEGRENTQEAPEEKAPEQKNEETTAEEAATVSVSESEQCPKKGAKGGRRKKSAAKPEPVEPEQNEEPVKEVQRRGIGEICKSVLCVESMREARARCLSIPALAPYCVALCVAFSSIWLESHSVGKLRS